MYIVCLDLQFWSMVLRNNFKRPGKLYKFNNSTLKSYITAVLVHWFYSYGWDFKAPKIIKNSFKKLKND